MNDRGWDIDRIVGEVLRRLQARVSPAGDVSTTGNKSTVGNGNNHHQRERSKHGLCLDERVVTLAVVEGRLEGIRRVTLRGDAVVTPAVRDELRKRNIAVERDDGRLAKSAEPSSLVCASTETSYDPSLLLAQVGGTPVTASTVPSAVEGLMESVRSGGHLGVLLTDRIAPALCLSNRHAGVRAAYGGNVNMVREAVQAVGANLLVIDPMGRSLAELTNMLREYKRCGPRDCPAEYRDVL